MDERLQFTELPSAGEITLICGWRQWADAGSVSSELPEYLVEELGARKIGELRPDGFYLFQIPGAHHLLRPLIELHDGLPQSLEEPRNEFFYAGDDARGVVIFIGDEPHLDIAGYAELFFAAVETLGAGLVAGVAGVYGPVPYNRERQISCIYSLAEMRERLDEYALDFSNYAGGASIGSYLVAKAGPRGIPALVFYAFAPAYDFDIGDDMAQGIRLENDYRSWYDITRRLNRLLNIEIDLADLLGRSEELAELIDKRVVELEVEMPELGIRELLEAIEADFTVTPFVLLDDVWEDEFRNLFGDEE
jgi:predicted ATP-grasp superfamily ATP-dependent carboligase